MEVLLQIQQQLRKKDWRGLYIHGAPGIGKTFIFKATVEALGLSRIYMPVPGHFFFVTSRSVMTVCCLKNSNFIISKAISGRLNKSRREHILRWMLNSELRDTES